MAGVKERLAPQCPHSFLWQWELASVLCISFLWFMHTSPWSFSLRPSSHLVLARKTAVCAVWLFKPHQWKRTGLEERSFLFLFRASAQSGVHEMHECVSFSLKRLFARWYRILPFLWRKSNCVEIYWWFLFHNGGINFLKIPLLLKKSLKTTCFHQTNIFRTIPSWFIVTWKGSIKLQGEPKVVQKISLTSFFL